VRQCSRADKGHHLRTHESIADLNSSAPATARLDISIIIVSFNTQAILRTCLQHAFCALEGLEAEVIVVDNNSHDGSAEMVAGEFPFVRLVRNPENVGFAAANNLAFNLAGGDYLVLLNSDAFVRPEAIRRSLAYMQANPSIGAGGACLIGAEGEWQPSARMFPSILNDFIIFTGLATRFRKSRFLGRADRTWADPGLPADIDWVPGAFMVISRQALDKTGYFDESFYFYYEEVDLCRRIKDAGYRIRYWPDVVVVHLVGGSSRQKAAGAKEAAPSRRSILWRLRSQFLYYRKHHGEAARVAMWCAKAWQKLRIARNTLRGAAGRMKLDDSRAMIASIDQAWRETRGGKYAPPRPW
jgi:GT2 family glycosyltransferase